MTILRTLLNLLLFRPIRARRAASRWRDALASEVAEEFLEWLLRLMGLVFWLDSGFRKNIDNFTARYLFCSRDSSITVAAVFNNGRLKVRERQIDDTDVTVVFRDGRALMDYLLSPKPDILGSLLRQDVVIDGNLNYVYKFAYMAKHLQLMMQS